MTSHTSAAYCRQARRTPAPPSTALTAWNPPRMFPLARVKSILLSPRTGWPVIDAEAATVRGIYRDYLVWLAAIPAIAGFIGLSVIGVGGLGVTFRVPVLQGLMNAVLGMAMMLATVWVMAWIVDALAPRFQARKDFTSAFKLVAYASTASMVSGLSYLLSAMPFLMILGALYGLYLLYLGLPVLMRCPPGRALPYTAVILVCGFLVNLVGGFLTAALVPSFGQTAGADLRIETPRGSVSVDTGKMEAMAKRIEESSRKVEEASRSGDPAAVGRAANDAMAAVAGALGGATGGRTPVAPADLKAVLPETLADLPRGKWESSGGSAAGVTLTSAKARYGEGARRIDLEITDPGTLAGIAAIVGQLATGERESAERLEKTYRSGRHMARERTDRGSGNTEFTLSLDNGLIVEARGHGVDVAALKGAVDGLDLARLESLAKARP